MLRFAVLVALAACSSTSVTWDGKYSTLSGAPTEISTCPDGSISISPPVPTGTVIVQGTVDGASATIASGQVTVVMGSGGTTTYTTTGGSLELSGSNDIQLTGEIDFTIQAPPSGSQPTPYTVSLDEPRSGSGADICTE